MREARGLAAHSNGYTRVFVAGKTSCVGGNRVSGYARDAYAVFTFGECLRRRAAAVEHTNRVLKIGFSPHWIFTPAIFIIDTGIYSHTKRMT